MLTGKQRAYLRSMAEKDAVIVQIGKGGLGDNVFAQIEEALDARELIKLKALETAGESSRRLCEIVCERAGAEPVSVKGNCFVIYRRSRKNPKIKL